MTQKKIRVLLIEDNPGDVRLIRELLCTGTRQAFELDVVESLSEATPAALSVCDVVLLDLFLPDSAGIQTFTTLFERSDSVPVIVLTGLGDEELSLRAIQMGAEDYLLKSDLEGYSLERSIRYAIERHRLRELAGQQRTEIQTSERRFRTMADLLPDMLFECDLELNVLYLNRAVESTLGFGEQDLRGGLHLSTLLGPGPFNQVRKQLVGATADTQTCVGTYNVLSKSGEAVACEIRSTTVTLDDGRPIGYLGVIRDVTERQKAEEAQRLAALGQLAAGVAHEFNNILGAMSGWAQLAQSDGRPEFWEKLASTVSAATLRGSGICNDLLTYARPQELKREPLHISGPVDAALSMATREIENAEVSVVRRIDPKLPQVLGDWSQLQQVFLNLIINACHAMPEGGVLTVSATETGGDGEPKEVLIKVADTGVGIPPENLARVFEPFFTTKRELGAGGKSGTGLGLYVSRGIIEAHGGSLSVRSTPGVGTTFEIRLSPYTKTAPCDSAEPESNSHSLPETEDRKLVLVADDEAAIREFVSYVLRQQGMDVIEAQTALQASQMICEKLPDVVITDLLMPGGGAKCVVDAARNLEHPPVVIVITGTGADFLETRLRELGQPPCIRKPIAVQDLLSTVAMAMGEATAGV
ncbi:MAG: response regulator [Armatimonadetes bacterium]|nr:response regulator [Armatimonadota bacterium]